ncbi:S1C family serine protease [Mesorhizobium sp. LHD-90]|uniref:S1C family serine protease n=1 Tax=Mesorhizobium sp. LHD-90 TaxID=3071414 RepID=UPI0027E17B11|nr:S1C family serine protease [Mesorhizobium sp. LHD-90]MDQ6436932.1 S1C family serine protease [Mesorhizobium sp. LHD-90]
MDLEHAMRSIVTLQSTIPEDAFTATVLGTQRSGSGVVIGDKGLVLTIGYLVTEAEDIWLTGTDGRAVPGHALAFDQETGFGLVQAMGAFDLPALEFGSSRKAKPGDKVVLAGGGRGQFVRADIVTKQEFAGYWEYLLDEAVFTAPAHPLWGGAGLIGADGKLLGIGSLLMQMAAKGSRQDINMVVPIDLLPPVLDDLLKYGRVDKPPRPWLGIYSSDNDDKVVVMDVDARGPAAAAGLKQGDVVTDVRDEQVDDLADFYRKVWKSGEAGVEIPMRVVRNGRDLWLRVKSADRRDFLRKPRLQ